MTDVTVVLPFRDAADTLEEALDSVLSQRGVAVEVLAVDDGSHDGGSAMAQRMAASHRGLTVLESTTPGLVGALRTGISQVRSELLARMDADDISLPDRIGEQVQRMRASPALSILGTRVELLSAQPIAGGMQRYIAWQNALLTEADHRAQLFVESPLCHPSTVMRTTALEQLGGYRDGPFPEDYDLWLRADAAGLAMAKLDSVGLRWRQGPGRATLVDPRYGPDRFLACKAPHLAARLRTRQGDVAVWGAGKTGRHLARALEPHGIRACAFVDVDPGKVGRTARDAPIVDPDWLRTHRPTWVVVAVGAAGARDEVRAHLDASGLAEGRDYLCAA